jgi:hypothetical protein
LAKLKEIGGCLSVRFKISDGEDRICIVKAFEPIKRFIELIFGNAKGDPQVLANNPFPVDTRVDSRSEETRFRQLGHTGAGRIPFVAWTIRGGKIRPVTAYDANRSIRAEYSRRLRNEERT